MINKQDKKCIENHPAQSENNYLSIMKCEEETEEKAIRHLQG